MQTCSKEVSETNMEYGKSRSRAINQGRCRYSHEYDLTDEQLIALANSAKQSPCWFLNNGLQVSFY